MNSKLAKDLKKHSHGVTTRTRFLINYKNQSQGAGKRTLFHLQLCPSWKACFKEAIHLRVHLHRHYPPRATLKGRKLIWQIAQFLAGSCELGSWSRKGQALFTEGNKQKRKLFPGMRTISSWGRNQGDVQKSPSPLLEAN